MRESPDMSATRYSPSGIRFINDLRRDGLDPYARVQATRFVRIQRGAYVAASEWSQMDSCQRYLVRIVATMSALKEVPVLSHHSAAALWGLPIVGSWPGRLHQIVGPDGGHSTTNTIRHQRTAVPAAVLHEGFLVTDVARTVVDMARATTFVSAVATADHALARRLCTNEDLHAALDQAAGGRGSRRARMVIEFADPASESVGESLSRARMHELHLPAPALQEPFRDRDGFIGRADFYWPRLRLVGEFDGKIKYRRDGYAGSSEPEDVVWREKVREDRLRGLGLGLVRWVWAQALDADSFGELLARHGVVRTLTGR